MIASLRRGDVVAAVLAVAVLAIVAIASSSRPVPGDTFAAADTRRGGYAAFAALLEREGVTTERFERRPVELDRALDTLIDAYAPGPAALGVRQAADVAALAGWVRAGGRLIVLGNDGQTADFEQRFLKRPAERDAGAVSGPFSGPLAATVSQLAALGGQRFVIPAHPGRGGALTLLGDRGGAVAVRVPLGAGSVDYVTQPNLFANAALGRADNARLAFELGRPRRNGGTVAFDEALHGAVVDRSWWAVLPVPLRVALGGIALALAAGLAGGALRLGPPVRPGGAREPSSHEFVAAVAALYERTHSRRRAIALLVPPAAGGPAAMRLRALAEREKPDDRDLLASAALARAIREEHGNDDGDRGRGTDTGRPRTRRGRE